MITETTIEARNTSPNSQNAIHTDEARKHGFRGGIVPGVTLYAYLVRPLVDNWGGSWLGAGDLEIRFRRPVYDGDQITLTTEPVDAGGTGMAVRVCNAEGEQCAVGNARRERDRPTPDLADYPSRPWEGASLEDGTPERLATAGTLMDYPVRTDGASVRALLDEIEEEHPLFDSILHPVFMAEVPAHMLGAQFIFGPRVLTSIRTRFYATSPVGKGLTCRGRIVRVHERKGNHYMTSDLVVVNSADQVIMQIDAESLFQFGVGSWA